MLRPLQLFIALCSSCLASSISVSAQTIIAGKVSNFKGNKITCTILPLDQKRVNLFLRVKNGEFQETINISACTLIKLSDGKNQVVGLLEPNDKIRWTYDTKNFERSISIDGIGREKSQFLEQLTKNSISLGEKSGTQSPAVVFTVIDNMQRESFYFLEKLKDFYSKDATAFLRATILSYYLLQRAYAVSMFYHTQQIPLETLMFTAWR